jgi:hypothetical protein
MGNCRLSHDRMTQSQLPFKMSCLKRREGLESGEESKGSRATLEGLEVLDRIE